MNSKRIHILLSVLILPFIAGFSFNQHFCKGSVEGVSRFTGSKYCKEKQLDRGHQKDHSNEKSDCCKENCQFLKLPDIGVLTEHNYNITPSLILHFINSRSDELLLFSQVGLNKSLNYSPLIITKRNFLVLQKFLL